MANVSWGKKLLAIAVACCACAMIAVPAYAFYYVHSDEGVQVESKGVYEVACWTNPPRAALFVASWSSFPREARSRTC